MQKAAINFCLGYVEKIELLMQYYDKVITYIYVLYITRKITTMHARIFAENNSLRWFYNQLTNGITFHLDQSVSSGVQISYIIEKFFVTSNE